MFKNVLIALSVLLNVCFLFFVFWGGGVVEKFSFIIANGLDQYDAELRLIDSQNFEDKFGVSKWVLINTVNSIEACSEDFRCIEAMEFIYFNSLVSSLAEYQGDVYACKAKFPEGKSPFTVLVTEKAKDPFQCVKMTKKYKGLSTDAIQSDSDGLEGIEKVEFL